MIVKENINFERGQDPKETMELGLLKALENKGIRIDLSWDKEGQELQRFKDNIKNMYEAVTLLIGVGVRAEKIWISGAHILHVNVHRVINGNHVIHEVLSIEDGENLIKVIDALSIKSGSGSRVSQEEDSKLIYDYEVIDWLKKLKENREKYKNLL
jgi:hypothetical protein